MNYSKIISVWFLSLLLVFAITPKDIFHEFHVHENEIEHVDLDCHNQHFEIKHNHCPVLNQVAPIFYASAEVIFSPFIKTLSEFKIRFKVFQKTPVKYLFGLKAPPIEILKSL
jgi:hypothetical protein